MIPKIIHYFWFGEQPLNELSKKCIDSWKKYCPDYEIKLWNEQNYDVTKNEYMRQTYDAKKYGFTVDYARLDVVYTYGGIYLDTDVELLKSLDALLNDKCFMGFESEKNVALGLGFGAEAGNEVIYSMMRAYDNMSFILPSGELNLRPSPGIQTEVVRELGLLPNGQNQIIGDKCHIYSKPVFNPCDIETNRIDISDETISIHHYAGSWLTKQNHRNNKIYSFAARCFGVKFARIFRKFYKKFF